MDAQQRLLDQQKQLCLGLVRHKPRIEEQSLNSMDVIKTLVAHQNVDETATQAIADGVKGYKALLRSDGLSQSSANSCLLARGSDPSPSLEQDFTTNGTQGNLHCPFSKPQPAPSGSEMQNGKDDGPKVQVDACGHDDLDPIRAELEERRSSTTPSGPSAGRSAGSSRCPVSRCPIRYLDKHSAEEIAEYVERHKHEIPRSHAICVNRYQRDPQNMRHLDAKYGSLINMISGLSAKHQVFLPNRQANGDGDHQTSHSASTQRVEKWAEDVDPNNTGPPAEEDNRQSHFDRPLREVRVGESPSRPWGIPVPIPEPPPDSAFLSGSAPVPVSSEPKPVDPVEKPAEASAKPAGRCPFGHDAPKPEPTPKAKPDPKPEPEPEPSVNLESPWADWADRVRVNENKGDAGDTSDQVKPDDPATNIDIKSLPAHITFNGPVFFGYSAEDTARLMQQFGQRDKS